MQKKISQSQVPLFFLYTALILALVMPVVYLNFYGLFEEFKSIYKIWSCLIVIYFLEKIISWYGSYALLTNEEIIIKHRRLFIHTSFHTLEFEKISSIVISKKSLSAAIFNYGNIEIFAMATTTPIVIERVANPKDWLEQIKLKIHIAKS